MAYPIAQYMHSSVEYYKSMKENLNLRICTEIELILNAPEDSSLGMGFISVLYI